MLLINVKIILIFCMLEMCVYVCTLNLYQKAPLLAFLTSRRLSVSCNIPNLTTFSPVQARVGPRMDVTQHLAPTLPNLDRYIS